MLISCKCLNFIASSSNDLQQRHHQQKHLQKLQKSPYENAADATADRRRSSEDGSMSPKASNATPAIDETSRDVNENELATSLMNSFLQKYQRNFIFYSQFMDFFKQSIGPASDVTINAINQRDLIYSLTLNVPIEKTLQTWQLSLCINCNVVFCAKRIQSGLNTPPASSAFSQQFLFNSSLITSNDEISQRRADKSFSDTFGILIMDHPEVTKQNGFSSITSGNNGKENGSAKTPTGPAPAFIIGSLSATSNLQLDAKQQRLRQLHFNLQQCLKREIAETNERIQRFTEQQFALLKSFREKSEQEYDLLVRLIQKVPDQNGEMLDSLPPMLEVTMGAVSYSRRRNTISSRRDLNTQTPTTPTTPNPNQLTQPPNFLPLMNINNSNKSSSNSNNNNTISAMETNQNTNTISSSSIDQTDKLQNIGGSAVSAAPSISSTSTLGFSSRMNAANTSNTPTAVVTTIVSNALNRKMSNFDTPPATPEATPMSIGNSPTFKQQQAQSQGQRNLTAAAPQQPPTLQFNQLPLQQDSSSSSHISTGFRLINPVTSFPQQLPTPTMEQADDCVFELEDDSSSMTSTSNSIPVISPPLSYQQQNVQIHLQMQRNLQYPYHQHNNDNTMSDLDESDVAEEAEDALDMDSSMPIPMMKTAPRSSSNNASSHLLNFAKSLPIEIANSPMAERTYIDDSDEEGLDNTVDIAASIKALAKSVHGEAVFGDLPRPRLRSQI